MLSGGHGDFLVTRRFDEFFLIVNDASTVCNYEIKRSLGGDRFMFGQKQHNGLESVIRYAKENSFQANHTLEQIKLAMPAPGGKEPPSETIAIAPQVPPPDSNRPNSADSIEGGRFFGRRSSDFEPMYGFPGFPAALGFVSEGGAAAAASGGAEPPYASASGLLESVGQLQYSSGGSGEFASLSRCNW